ncbi:UPF0415 protein C7orf25 [Nymphon striatum]|nr:UPF0415 protein C7orf25 [Nymphon striatum]
MATNTNNECNNNLLISRIGEAEALIEQSQSLISIQGQPKLIRKIKAELVFLKQLQKSGNYQEDSLKSSNLNNLSAIVQVACNYSGKVFALYHPVKYVNENNIVKRQIIDIVADGGSKWIKVVARNPFALERICIVGDSGYGVRTLLDQAKDLIKYSQHNLHVYNLPTIVMHFFCGITELLCEKISKLGIIVEGKVIQSKLSPDEDEYDSEDDEFINNIAQINISQNISCANSTQLLNLDISTLISYVSSLTNGGCNHIFREPVLNDEAIAERARPVKPILDELFHGATLYSCETAVFDFKRILNCVGGPNEVKRAEELLSRVTVLPDNISETAKKLVLKGSIKKRSQIIFGTGESNKALTVTANSAFIRAAAVEGVKFAVFEHEARALSEKKQAHAAPLSQE